MISTWPKALKEISKIEGYLVPGQETTLYKLASSLKPGATIVEIGSYKGRSTACLAYGAPKDARIYAIDTFEGNKKDFIEEVQFEGGNFYKEFVHNLKSLRVSKKVKPVKGFSYDIGQKWKKKIDLIFIDGSHLYEDVKKDFELFFPWVKSGGIIAFHDVSNTHPGVYRLWNEITKRQISAYMHETTLYFGTKPSTKSSAIQDKEKLKKAIGYKNQKVVVVLPVYNRIEFTKKCANSLQKQTYKNIEIIIVDADSDDNTSSFIKENYSDWKIIHGSKNWWWTRSMFEGVKKALKITKKGDFILSMNNDCILEEGYIANIVEASNTNRRAIVGSLIVDAERPSIVIDAGVKIDWAQGLIYGVAPNYSAKAKFYKDREMLEDIDTLPGKGTLIPVEVFKKIGNFNYLLLPHYIGDYEFFCRAKEAGFRLTVSASAILLNFSKQTGIYRTEKEKASYYEILKILFSRKSKLNVIDHLIFVLLCCPREYLLKNIKSEIRPFISNIIKVFPLYYFPTNYYKIKLFFHNIPIFIRQNTTTKRVLLIIHNVPIVIKQNTMIQKGIHFIRTIPATFKQSKIVTSILDAKQIQDRAKYSVNYGYQKISNIEALKLSNAWLHKSLPKSQMKLMSPILKNGIVPKMAVPVINILKNMRGKKYSLLDVGCSGGYFYDFFRSSGLDFIYEGCDMSPYFVQQARIMHKKLKFTLGKIEYLPYKNNSFDIVLASGVLHYSTDCIKAIKELARVSSRYIIIHRLPVFVGNHKTEYFTKIGYGIVMPEIFFNLKELQLIFKGNHLRVVSLTKNSVIDRKITSVAKAYEVTLFLEKISH